MRNSICPKCGCKEIISGARIVDHGHLNTAQDLSATVYAKPQALVFRGAVSSPFHTYVCGECGYTEFYVEHPKALLKASNEANA